MATSDRKQMRKIDWENAFKYDPDYTFQDDPPDNPFEDEPLKIDEPVQKGPGGPTTPEGKQRSSKNSTKHGCRAKTVVLPGESQEEFDDLYQRWHSIYPPGHQNRCQRPHCGIIQTVYLGAAAHSQRLRARCTCVCGRRGIFGRRVLIRWRSMRNIFGQQWFMWKRNPVWARLVEHAGDWRWSSAPVHLGRAPSGLVNLVRWRREFDASRWEHRLLGEAAACRLEERIRAATLTGHPLGNDEFRQDLRIRLQLPVAPAKPGRPKKPVAAQRVAAIDMALKVANTRRAYYKAA